MLSSAFSNTPRRSDAYQVYGVIRFKLHNKMRSSRRGAENLNFRFHFSLIFYLMFEIFKEGRFTVLIFLRKTDQNENPTTILRRDSTVPVSQVRLKTATCSAMTP
ncbi:uncharacterized protein LACBIDRAFT_333365 [Laccaria bicolor S238N-H82]|uniref:Predicted protein n=1 Tax=Laccaria bicolor (strain S238N-H82 / ATCC MYA-4686) TaxID=486041 RepID=B0DVP2_LACBS|nr:uncharacterized protein LACBIDRAFT_333365 [Laccaria bicolor S238N-H82]EDR01337.1 predicted protein [Laccaria bicolor S238N-H82]|eukprot:XP_001888044.1 predicted protein [Laccaria bicolor S238N-H82]